VGVGIHRSQDGSTPVALGRANVCGLVIHARTVVHAYQRPILPGGMQGASLLWDGWGHFSSRALHIWRPGMVLGIGELVPGTGH
jgi:hypothetical protein